MNYEEKAILAAIKEAFKLGVERNPNLTSWEKQQAKQEVENRAQVTEQTYDLLRKAGIIPPTKRDE
ncbi:MAG: hypothetical protein LKJ90_04115 [Faecalibacterium sp.]|jgi:hypothetical protein|nr:hypothetical protein [Faecalibacterium sp.]